MRQMFWYWDSVSVARPAGGELSLGMKSMSESEWWDAGCVLDIEALEWWEGRRSGELVSGTENIISGIDNSLAALLWRSGEFLAPEAKISCVRGLFDG